MARREMAGKFRVLAFAAIILLFIDGATAKGRKTLTDFEIERELSRLNKLAIKTIKRADGDIIDCVDIYRQPAFDHPLLKNHTIQLRPSNYDDKREKESSFKTLGQVWHKNGSCPDGTIPIRRTQKGDLLSPSLAASPTESAKLDLETPNQGGEAVINIWKPNVQSGEFSSAAIFVGVRGKIDFVCAGWMVAAPGDDVRLFGYWASDSGGCTNLACAGFVQTNKNVALGVAIGGYSTYDGDQAAFLAKIYRDKQTGNWWLVYNNDPVGYWPSSLFKDMSEGATYIQWGGQVTNHYPGGQHTTTQMGSGHFPSEGFKKAAFFDKCVYYDEFTKVTPSSYPTIVDKPDCYDISPFTLDKGDSGLSFFYGGPGGTNCG